METKNIAPKKVLVATTKTTHSTMSKDIEGIMTDIMGNIEKGTIKPAGPMEFIYFGATEDMNKEYKLEIAVPVAEETQASGSNYEVKETSPLKCVTTVHKGSMENVMATYDQLFADLMKDGLQPTDEVREVYHKWIDLSSDENITEIQVGIN